MNVGRSIIRHGELIPAAILALALAWAPWPYGSVVPWAEALLVTAVCAALAVAALAAPSLSAFRPVLLPAAALTAIALLGLCQSLPWPRALLGVASPTHLRLAEEAEAALDPPSGTVPSEAVEARRPADGGPVPASVAPAASRRAAVSFAAAAAALAAAAMAGRWRPARRILGASLVAVTLLQIPFGAPGWRVGASLVGGGERGDGRLHGGFVNPNHFAGFLEIALAVTFAWAWWGWRRSGPEVPPERRIVLAAPPVLVWLTLFVALAFTGSRAGLAAGVAGAIVQGGLIGLSLRRRAGRRGDGGGRRWTAWLPWAVVGVAVAGAGIGLVALVGYEQGLGRLASTSPYELGLDVRADVYRATFELWKAFWTFGAGVGTFSQAFPLVQSGQYEAVGLYWRHAHNDWLELLATSGVAGALLLLVGLGAVVVRLARGLRSGLRSEDRAASLAALGALAAFGVHELADFGLTMPANWLALALVVGAAAGAVRIVPRAPAQDSPGPSAPPE